MKRIIFENFYWIQRLRNESSRKKNQKMDELWISFSAELVQVAWADKEFEIEKVNNLLWYKCPKVNGEGEEGIQ